MNSTTTNSNLTGMMSIAEIDALGAQLATIEEERNADAVDTRTMPTIPAIPVVAIPQPQQPQAVAVEERYELDLEEQPWQKPAQPVRQQPKQVVRTDRNSIRYKGVTCKMEELTIRAIGDTSILDAHITAILTARDTSPSGRETVTGLAKWLAPKGVNIIVGSIRDIELDIVNAALERGGKVIIFLAQGIDTVNIAPIAGWVLRDQILLISATELDDPWTQEAAERRNAIMIGYADNVFVGECTSVFSGGTWNACMIAKKMGVQIYIKKIDAQSRSRNKVEQMFGRMIANNHRVLVSVLGAIQIEGKEADRLLPRTPVAEESLANA